MSRLLIFDRKFTCIYDKSWNAKTDSNEPLRQETMQLIMGMCYSLRTMLSKLSPQSGNDTSYSYRTDRYRLFYYEVPSGWKFVLLVAGTPIIKSSTIGGQTVTLETALSHLWSTIFIEWVIRNPLFISNECQTIKLVEGGAAGKIGEFMQLPIFHN